MSVNRTIPLKNGLCLHIDDQTNRYFGDYHRVRLVVRCVVSVATVASRPDCELEAAQLQRLLGEEICYEKVLERMGVAGAAVEQTSEELLKQFLVASGDYLERDDFPLRLLRQRFRARAGIGLAPYGR